MFCPNCGNEIKEGKNFCTKCGVKVDIQNETVSGINKTAIIAVSVIVFVIAFSLISYFLIFNKQNFQIQQTVNNVVEEKTEIQEKINQPKKFKKLPSDILDEINSYQDKYWKIVKRHDALLMSWSDDDKEKDREELNSLFKEVTNKIDSNNEFLTRYYEIEEEFKECPYETTVEMNEFALKNYEAVDKLLNDTYKAVKAKLSEEDFEQLKSTQRKWLKEVMAYKSVFDEQGFGTIGTIIYYDYEINMRNFRTLLLMLY